MNKQCLAAPGAMQELPGDIALSSQALLMVFATDQAFQSAVNGRLF